jgi:hypothetical protein
MSMRFAINEPPPPTRWNFLSLGAGVQSSTLALMAAHGEVTPHLDAAIFADTQAEPRAVYRWLDWLEGEIARSPHPFPVHRVSAGSLRLKALDTRVTADGRRFSKVDIPFFTRNDDGTNGMVTNRSCTEEFKIRPILRQARVLAGITRGQREVTVTSWLGISWDELQRMKDSRAKWAQNRWPLVERRIRRADCVTWMRAHGYPDPPRSACEFCPFHDDADWRNLRDHDPEAFARAVQFERDLQGIKAESERFRTMPYLHVTRRPLDTVDFSTAEERGQLGLGFANECEGMCGV